MLAVKDVVATYDRLPALEHVTLQVRAGEKLAVVGPSGCGKSTLLSCIAGFVKPDSGSVELEGRPILGPGPDRMVVFQELDQLLPWRTVLGNITWALEVTGRAKGEAAVELAKRQVKAMRLGGFENALAHQLSGGMKQRAAIARALALEPKVCLMDEPFAAIDALTRRELQELVLQAFTGSQRVLVMVTHAIDEAVFVGDQIAVFSPRPARVLKLIENPAVGQRGGASAEAVRAEVEALLEGSAPS